MDGERRLPDPAVQHGLQGVVHDPGPLRANHLGRLGQELLDRDDLDVCSPTLYSGIHTSGYDRQSPARAGEEQGIYDHTLHPGRGCFCIRANPKRHHGTDLPRADLYIERRLGAKETNMNPSSVLKPIGALGIKVKRAKRAPLAWRIENVCRLAYIRGWLAVHIGVPLARAFGLAVAYGKLEALKICADGRKINYGVLGYRVVTTAFVNFVTDQLQTETSVFGDFKFHDSGVGTTAENVADTGIETTDGESRATGTQTESAANAYRSVGTISYTTTKAITEHGLFNDVTAGTLMDRTVFTVINVVNGDSIQFTYTLTISAGG